MFPRRAPRARAATCKKTFSGAKSRNSPLDAAADRPTRRRGPQIERRPMTSRGAVCESRARVATRRDATNARRGGSDGGFRVSSFACARGVTSFFRLRARRARGESRRGVASPGDHPEALRCWNWTAYTGMYPPINTTAAHAAPNTAERPLVCGVAGGEERSRVSFRVAAMEKNQSAPGEPSAGSGLALGWRNAEVAGSEDTYRADVVHLLGVDVRLRWGRKRGGRGQRRDARRERRGTLAKISPANGRAEPREGSGGARARTGSPSPPRLGAEVLKLRTGAVRARCVSARRAALTRALDMRLARRRVLGERALHSSVSVRIF